MSDSPLFQRRVQDQAYDLRLLAAGRRAEEGPLRVSESTRVVAVTSGKGGVGKTSLTVNLAVSLARRGKRIIILDCDLGTANVDVMLGMHPLYSLQHVLARQKTLEEVMTTGPYGIRVISGGSGFSELANLTDLRREELLNSFASLDGQADVLLLDTGAGISANVLRFVIAAGEALVVTTPEPTAVTDAYALIKVVTQQAPDLPLRLVVNQANSQAEAQETATNIVTVARRFLGVEVTPFGSIPSDRAMPQAVRQQVPAVDAYPRTPAALAIDQIGQRLLAAEPPIGDVAEAPLAAPITVADALQESASPSSTPSPQDAALAAAPPANGRAQGVFGQFLHRLLAGPQRKRTVG